MCKKLKELNGKTPADLLELSNQTGAFPIDVAEICYKMGIHLVPFDFNMLDHSGEAEASGSDLDENKTESDISTCEEDRDQILGAIIVRGDDLAILYKSDDLENNRRFTIAHEIAHSCLDIEQEIQVPKQNRYHVEFLTDSQNKQKKEKEQQADRFARQLLIPAESLRRLIGDSVRVSTKSVPTLAMLFMVSEDVMWKRLLELNISVVDRNAKRYAMLREG